MRGVVLAALIATPALAGSQRLSDDLRMPEFEGGRAVARIMVLQDAPYPSREITFYAVPIRGPGIDPLEGPLSAFVTQTNGPPRVARSATCPALRVALESMKALPPVPVSPSALAVVPGIAMPIEPTKKDGARYEITVEVETPNRAPALLRVNDYSGDYAIWAEAIDRALGSCWTRWP
jgi:hypothetical protein